MRFLSKGLAPERKGSGEHHLLWPYAQQGKEVKSVKTNKKGGNSEISKSSWEKKKILRQR